MSKVSISISCFILIFVTSVAMATPAITNQTWTFSNADNPTDPDPGFSNVYGTPKADLSTTGDPDYFGWMSEYIGRAGVWAGDPLQIELIIPNNPLPNAYKEIWLEMGFQSILQWLYVLPSPVSGSVEEISRDISAADPDGWRTLTIGWRIEPNPNKEKICISLIGTGGFVDYITVNTACVPEPATLTLLGLGTLVLLKRKRK